MNVKIKRVNAKNTKVKVKVVKSNPDSKEFRRWRKKSGITQIDFCKEAGISQATLSNFENNRTSVSDDMRRQIYRTFVRLNRVR